MRKFYTFIAYLYHPLFFPLAGTIAYYIISPRYHPVELWKSVVISVTILTLLIPLAFSLLLKSIGWITSIELKEVSERKIPLYIFIFLVGVIIYRVIPFTFSIELYYYFVGILGSALACLFLVFFDVKASIHMMGISGLTFFILGLSFHYQINITIALTFLVLSTGLVASARLFTKAHNFKEIILGLFLGVIPQLITFNYWL
jgi:Na+/glutamate symporter